MNDDDKRYIRRQLGNARPWDATEKIQLKVRSSAGESHWVRIPSDLYEQMITTLAGPAV